MSPKTNRVLSASAGALFTFALVTMSVVDSLTPAQFALLRFVVAAAAAAVAATVPGFLQVRVHNWIRAAGALSTFVIVYFWSPAAAMRNSLPQAVPTPTFAVVKVFFGTDRTLESSQSSRATFGSMRGKLTLGAAEVSIPRDHRMGELEAPSIWRFEIREDPARHVVLLNTRTQSRDSFFAEISKRVSGSGAGSALLFIHGYNVSFEDAARRTAQIAYDIGFSGAPVFYSWPSQDATAQYTVDEQNVEWSQGNLRVFLLDFLSRDDLRRIYVIAHSMGNRAMTRALASVLAERPDLRSKVAEIILAAPDIDAEVFRRDIAPSLIDAGRPITLYASSGDRALIASKKVHGYRRAGDSGPGLVVISGIETVDATAVDTSFLGHSYFAERRSVLSDIFSIVRNGKRANERFGLVQTASPTGTYWVFRP